MKQAGREAAVLVTAVILILGLSVLGMVQKDKGISLSERRALAGFPEADADSILSGEFMDRFETYAQDQFPFRDTFRRLKALTVMGLLQKQDNNGIYYEEGHLGKLDYPLQTRQQEHILERMDYLYRTWLEGKGGKLYFSVVPDKNYYLAGTSYPTMDYEQLIKKMQEGTPYLTYIDITDCLGAEDYYNTDTHWKQEELEEVAHRLAEAMEVKLEAEYSIKEVEVPFYGVYAGQSALPVRADRIRYLTNSVLEDCLVTSYDTGQPVVKEIYDVQKLSGNDLYEFFLSGADALMTIENPHAKEEKELIVFRDSFGSSLIPLLVPAYSQITVIDTRYISSSLLGSFVSFENKDVLFLYSTLLLNSSMGMK